MTRLSLICVALGTVLLLGCASADPDRPTAADKTYSSWRGTMTPTGGETINISYLIRLQAQQGSGRIIFPSFEEEGDEYQIDMEQMKWDGETLEYSWRDRKGTKLSCRLAKRSDTLLSGGCVDPKGGLMAEMTMSPPAGRLDRI